MHNYKIWKEYNLEQKKPLKSEKNKIYVSIFEWKNKLKI